MTHWLSTRTAQDATMAPTERAAGRRLLARMGRICLSLGLMLEVAFATVGLSACQGRRATAQDCDRIFDRLVEVELAERGLHDPVLLQRRAQVLRSSLVQERASCVGRPLPPAALDCIARAPNAEAVVHRCLR